MLGRCILSPCLNKHEDRQWSDPTILMISKPPRRHGELWLPTGGPTTHCDFAMLHWYTKKHHTHCRTHHARLRIWPEDSLFWRRIARCWLEMYYLGTSWSPSDEIMKSRRETWQMSAREMGNLRIRPVILRWNFARIPLQMTSGIWSSTSCTEWT